MERDWSAFQYLQHASEDDKLDDVDDGVDTDDNYYDDDVINATLLSIIMISITMMFRVDVRTMKTEPLTRKSPVPGRVFVLFTSSP